MWNDHQTLNLLANILLVGVISIAIYAIGVRVLALPFFSLREIRVESVDHLRINRATPLHVSREQLESILKNTSSGNFMTVDLQALQRALTELPWVRSATISREWPPVLRILIEEHVPLAYWGKTALINTHGEIFHANSPGNVLPVFAADDPDDSRLISRNYKIFRKMLQSIEQNIMAVVLTPRHAWHIRLNTGTWLKLGRKEIKSRLQRYISVMRQHNHSLDREGLPPYVDLRYPDGFAIGKPSGVVANPLPSALMWPDMEMTSQGEF
ncbi:MAG: cell division protein FtsQ/DivIB [Nitrosomonas sp.]|nr:cell division protein FtsQ/DivIB [Nitrosomonas sp.]